MALGQSAPCTASDSFHVQVNKETVLAYYNNDDSCWEEENDTNTIAEERIRNGEREFLLCSTTDHFTSFAMLLGDGMPLSALPTPHAFLPQSVSSLCCCHPKAQANQLKRLLFARKTRRDISFGLSRL